MAGPAIDGEAAVRHLKGADPVLGALIESVGGFGLQVAGGDAFTALARAIVFQQLSGSAAGTIYGRLAALLDGDLPPGARRTDPEWKPPARFGPPVALLALPDEAMRGAGVSRQKIAALRSLAEHFESGELGDEPFGTLEDEAVIERLTRVRGVGRWTAEMFLMFHLGRPDVLPVNDVGINRAIQRQYGLEAPPKPADVQRVGAPWRPWATVACWYLWRSEDVRLPGPG